MNGHTNIIKYALRGYSSFQERFNDQSKWFKSAEDMNRIMIERWNEKIKPTDTVIHGGDFSMGDSYSFFKQLNGEIHLVRGNHDKEKYIKNVKFKSISEELYCEIGGKKLWISHIPYGKLDKYTEARYKRPEATQLFDIALCGHVHQAWKINKSGCINIGTEFSDFYPQTLTEVLNTDIQKWLDLNLIPSKHS